jgi:hypothetical protein
MATELLPTGDPLITELPPSVTVAGSIGAPTFDGAFDKRQLATLDL